MTTRMNDTTAGTTAGRRAWLPWLGTAARLLVGTVFIVAGALKIGDPAQSVRAVRAYRLLPEAIVPAVGYGLPFFEIALGLLLVLGIAVRLSAAVSAVVLVLFMTGIAAAWARGLQIDCGCFSEGGEVGAGQTRYPQELARDAGLVAVALALVRWPASRLALAGAGPGTLDEDDEYEDEYHDHDHDEHDQTTN